MRYMEPADVREGEYRDSFLLDGRRLAAQVIGDGVSLRANETVDLAKLRVLLASYLPTAGPVDTAEDLIRVAQEVWRRQRRSRWPRRPGTDSSAPPSL
jgi:hypothetical protein